jgi:hypothetical protein
LAVSVAIGSTTSFEREREPLVTYLREDPLQAGASAVLGVSALMSPQEITPRPCQETSREHAPRSRGDGVTRSKLTAEGAESPAVVDEPLQLHDLAMARRQLDDLGLARGNFFISGVAAAVAAGAAQRAAPDIMTSADADDKLQLAQRHRLVRVVGAVQLAENLVDKRTRSAVETVS